MNTLLLEPSDVVFFRDGRPMGGALAGHGAAWPLPHTLNAALHAALHRANIPDAKKHNHRINGESNGSERKFGSLFSAGPFPVRLSDGQWFFPRPADAQRSGCACVTLRPLVHAPGASSLPPPLLYPTANTAEPSKLKPEPWMNASAFAGYLGLPDGSSGIPEFLKDENFFDAEHNIGIAIDAATGTTGHGDTEGQLYNAHYLRLREGWALGMAAQAGEGGGDLITRLFQEQSHIVVGGQQRVCSTTRSDGMPPFPRGRAQGFPLSTVSDEPRWLVKWVLLTPAIWPEIPPTSKTGVPMNAHPGGWLPNWVQVKWNPQIAEVETHDDNGKVLLTDGLGVKKAQRKKGASGNRINAHLVAAVVPKSIVVTGWALANNVDRAEGGAKSTHLAVPAGAVYYFEAASEADAHALAKALNWHDEQGQIKNRRSTLCGEKGFGLGICGAWHPLSATLPDVPESESKSTNQ